MKDNKFKKYICCIFTIAINLAVAVIIGMILLCLVYMIPISPIEKNVRQSANVIRTEGTYPKVTEYATSQMDNFTDSIMMLEAADDSDGSAMDRAMFVYRGVIDGMDRAEGLAAHFLDGSGFTRKYDYSRYWHGYLVILKPLFSLFGYTAIRIMNGIAQIFITCLIVLLMYKKNMKKCITPYIISYLMLMPVAMARSLQFSNCFYIMSFGALALLVLNGRQSKIKHSDNASMAALIFLNIGILTAYFDLLTYPMATFGVPAVMYLFLIEGDGLINKIKKLITKGILWCVGYGGMWVSKWAVGSLLTGTNLFDNATTVFKQRTSSTSSDGLEHFGIYASVRANYVAFLKTPVTLLLILLFIYQVIRVLIAFKRKQVSIKEIFMRAIPFVLLAFAPMVWYVFARNHSAIHYWFTNKACVVTAFAGLSILANPNKERTNDLDEEK